MFRVWYHHTVWGQLSEPCGPSLKGKVEYEKDSPSFLGSEGLFGLVGKCLSKTSITLLVCLLQFFHSLSKFPRLWVYWSHTIAGNWTTLWMWKPYISLLLEFFPQIQWDFLVFLSDVCLNFQSLGLLENAEPRVQQSSLTVSGNHDSRFSGTLLFYVSGSSIVISFPNLALVSFLLILIVFENEKRFLQGEQYYNSLKFYHKKIHPSRLNPLLIL